jgi:AsmA protein
MRALKWILLGLVALIVLVGVGVAILVATFNPNDYKPRLVELVKQRTGRTLAIDGPIELRLFPKIGASIGKATLSEPHGTAPFARVEEARVAVALIPLLSRQVVVDRVTLKGLALDLVRRKDGRTNFDDLTGQSGARPAQPPGSAAASRSAGAPLVFDVGGIALDNASIRWRDERDGTDVRLSDVALKTGRLASGVPGKLDLAARIDGVQPRAHLQLDVTSAYRVDLAAPSVALTSLDVKAVGDAPGFAGLEARIKGETVDVDPKIPRVTLARVEVLATSKDGLDAKIAVPRLELAPDRAQSQAISGNVALTSGPRAIAAKLELAPITASGGQIPFSQMGVDFTVKEPDRTLSGKVKAAVAIDLEHRQAELRGIAGDLTLTAAFLRTPSKGSVTGGARADWGAENASARLAIKLDDSNLDATAAVAHWTDPVITFSVVADRLNIDRYQTPTAPRAAAGGGAGGGASPSAAAPAETPIDLSALRNLNATGTVKLGELRTRKVKAENVALTIKAADGRLDVNPITATVYQGTLAGAATANAVDMSFATRQKVSGVDVGPLLRDAAGEDILEGRGTVSLDVTATGRTVTALKKALAGTADLALKDGAIKGVDIPGIIRLASTLLGGKGGVEQPTQGGARTEFTELTASFKIAHGVAHNDDLSMKSPALRLTGRGDIDIGEDKIDYTAKAAIVAPPAGQGPKELAQLAGVTVPVRAIGPLGSPNYIVDVQVLATELAKSQLGRELERRLGGGGKSGSQSGSSGIDALGDALRGLFGKPK